MAALTVCRVANVLVRSTLGAEGEFFARINAKGEPNGLETAENRRSVSRNGNQHVYVRYPQVSGTESF